MVDCKEVNCTQKGHMSVWLRSSSPNMSKPSNLPFSKFFCHHVTFYVFYESNAEFFDIFVIRVCLALHCIRRHHARYDSCLILSHFRATVVPRYDSHWWCTACIHLQGCCLLQVKQNLIILWCVIQMRPFFGSYLGVAIMLPSFSSFALTLPAVMSRICNSFSVGTRIICRSCMTS